MNNPNFMEEIGSWGAERCEKHTIKQINFSISIIYHMHAFDWLKTGLTKETCSNYCEYIGVHALKMSRFVKNQVHLND